MQRLDFTTMEQRIIHSASFLHASNAIWIFLYPRACMHILDAIRQHSSSFFPRKAMSAPFAAPSSPASFYLEKRPKLRSAHPPRRMCPRSRNISSTSTFCSERGGREKTKLPGGQEVHSTRIHETRELEFGISESLTAAARATRARGSRRKGNPTR